METSHKMGRSLVLCRARRPRRAVLAPPLGELSSRQARLKGPLPSPPAAVPPPPKGEARREPKGRPYQTSLEKGRLPLSGGDSRRPEGVGTVAWRKPRRRVSLLLTAETPSHRLTAATAPFSRGLLRERRCCFAAPAASDFCSGAKVTKRPLRGRGVSIPPSP